ncbi:hypothetical protein AB0F77_03345 [Streptomyces sp. NPDC026672]|uniref:hypothetical protein n=1 Tax=unclassified Streptomyces TaxID=2593676 RepID=UPI0033D6031F
MTSVTSHVRETVGEEPLDTGWARAHRSAERGPRTWVPAVDDPKTPVPADPDRENNVVRGED